jgi:hypothetical protein
MVIESASISVDPIFPPIREEPDVEPFRKEPEPDRRGLPPGRQREEEDEHDEDD